MVTVFPWLSMATLLGVRHGFDPDHLAAIDGVCRLEVASRPRLARHTGVWFALGHGLVVTLVALLAQALTGPVAVPGAWAGWIAPGVLILVGLLNVCDGPRPGRLPAVRWPGLTKAGRPAPGAAAVVATGALFAVTFDTASQISLWVLSGTEAHGLWFAGLLGAGFTGGMMLTDGLNGFWLARALGRPGLRQASRWGIGLIAFVVAGVEILQLRAVPLVADHEATWTLALTLLAATPSLVLWRRQR